MKTLELVYAVAKEIGFLSCVFLFMFHLKKFFEMSYRTTLYYAVVAIIFLIIATTY